MTRTSAANFLDMSQITSLGSPFSTLVSTLTYYYIIHHSFIIIIIITTGHIRHNINVVLCWRCGVGRYRVHPIMYVYNNTYDKITTSATDKWSTCWRCLHNVLAFLKTQSATSWLYLSMAVLMSDENKCPVIHTYVTVSFHSQKLRGRGPSN